jgi:hypothetical protein
VSVVLPFTGHHKRTAEDKRGRFCRLRDEFVEDPCDERKERLLDAFRAWRLANPDRRAIALQPGLDLLERTADRMIEARRKNGSR